MDRTDTLVVAVRFRGDESSFELEERATFSDLVSLIAERWKCKAQSIQLQDSDSCTWPLTERCSLWAPQLPDGVIYARLRVTKEDSGQKARHKKNLETAKKLEENTKGAQEGASPRKRKKKGTPYVRKTRAILLQERQKKEVMKKSRTREMNFTTSGDKFRRRIRDSKTTSEKKRLKSMTAPTVLLENSEDAPELTAKETPVETKGVADQELEREAIFSDEKKEKDAWEKLESDLKDLVLERDFKDAPGDIGDIAGENRDLKMDDNLKVVEAGGDKKGGISIDIEKQKSPFATQAFELRRTPRSTSPSPKMAHSPSMLRFKLTNLSFNLGGTGENGQRTIDAHAELWRIFTFYCLQSSKPGRIQHMSNKQFRKFLEDSKLLRSGRHLSRQEVDLTFMKASHAKTSFGYLSFEQFLEALKQVAKQFLVSRNRISSEGDVSKELIRELIYEFVFSNARRWDPDPKMKLLKTSAVSQVLDLYRDFFEKLIKVYTSSSSPGMVDFKTFLSICNVFSITSLKLTAFDIGKLFLMSKNNTGREILENKDRDKLALPEFISCIGLIALHVFDSKRIPYDRKIKALIMHMALHNHIDNVPRSYSRRHVNEVAQYLHGKFIEMWIRDGRQNYLEAAPTKESKYKPSSVASILDNFNSPEPKGSPKAEVSDQVWTKVDRRDSIPISEAGEDDLDGSLNGTRSSFFIEDQVQTSRSPSHRPTRAVSERQMDFGHGSGLDQQNIFDELENVLESDFPKEQRISRVSSSCPPSTGSPLIARRNTMEISSKHDDDDDGCDGKRKADENAKRSRAAKGNAGDKSASSGADNDRPYDMRDKSRRDPQKLGISLDNLDRTQTGENQRDAKQTEISFEDGKGNIDERDMKESDQVADGASRAKMDEENDDEGEKGGNEEQKVLKDPDEPRNEGSESQKNKLEIGLADEGLDADAKIAKRKKVEVDYQRADTQPVTSKDVSESVPDSLPVSNLLPPEEVAELRALEKELADGINAKMDMDNKHLEEEEEEEEDPDVDQGNPEVIEIIVESEKQGKNEEKRESNTTKDALSNGKNRKSEGKHVAFETSKSGRRLPREDTVDRKVNDLDSGNRPDEIEESLLKELQKGSAFIKYGRRGRPSERILWVSGDGKSLVWGQTRHKFSKKFPLSDIRDVLVGQKTDLFKRRIKKEHKKEIYTRKSFSILLDGKQRSSVDLIALTDDTFELWIRALDQLVSEDKRLHPGQLEHYVARMKSTKFNILSPSVGTREENGANAEE